MATSAAADLVRKAFDRARGRTALVHYTGDTGAVARYLVDSATSTDVAHEVLVVGDRYSCDCPSGARPCCWHRCAVHARRVNDRLRAAYEARASIEAQQAEIARLSSVRRGLRGADLAAIFAA